MEVIEIRELAAEDRADLWLKNESFSMPGRMVPALSAGKWSYYVEYFAEPETMVFPDKPYDFDTLDANGVIFGAYDGPDCVGLAIYQLPFLKHLYLYDLKVCGAYRGQGAADGSSTQDSHGPNPTATRESIHRGRTTT